MNRKYCFCLLIGASVLQYASSQVQIRVDANAGNRPISPYIYGKNGAVLFETPPATDEDMVRNRESGLRFSRQNNGNNATKYNWRRKLTCHPDWYNNIYSCNWDKSAQNLQEEFPQIQGMYAFQLIGKAAKTNEFNFNDWEYNKSQWGAWCSLDVCGGGELDADGNLIKKGNPDLYLEDWPADSTVGIYAHWRDELGINMNQFKYWNMDNEFEMWPWTHSDVIEKNTNEVFEMMMQNYFATAKAIRAIDPTVKLTGPVAGSEWTWYTPADGQPIYNNKKYCWLEYFIMRCAEEEKKSGVRMLDVLDIHFYPGDKSVYDVLQSYRVFWDKEYDYPQANGVKTVNGGWDNDLKREYIIARCQEWVKKYFGDDREIPYGVSEYDNTEPFSPTVTALSYASFLGDGARHGMEYFTPWTWNIGMWETLHLFGRYAKEINVGATSSDELMISAYSSVNETKDSLTIILVNRNETGEQTVDIQLSNIQIPDGTYEVLTLSNLPNEETFMSHAENALKSGKLDLKENSVKITLPALSLTAVVLGNESSTSSATINAMDEVVISPNPSNGRFLIYNAKEIISVEIFDYMGQKVMHQNGFGSNEIRIDANHFKQGVYLVRLNSKNETKIEKIVIK